MTEDLEYYQHHQYLKSDEPSVEIIQDGVVGPSGICRGEKCPDIVDKTAIYLGHFQSSHWGNFLIDNLSRLWYALQLPRSFVCVYASERLDIISRPSYKKVLSYLGIDDSSIIRVTQPTCFKELIVPQESFVHDSYVSPIYLDIYDRITSAVRLNPDLNFEKVYFTRRQLKRRKEVGERIFEEFFRLNGFKVLAPEKLSLEDQISVVHNCKVIASIEGTLAHNIVFAHNGNCGRQIILKKQSFVIPRQFQLNEVTGIPAEYLKVYAEPFKKFPLNYDRGPFLLWWNRQAEEFARREGMTLPRFSFFWKLSYCFEYVAKCAFYWAKYKAKAFIRLIR